MSIDPHHSSADSQPGDGHDARWAAFGADHADDTDEHDFWGEQAEWPTAAIPVTTADRVAAQETTRTTDNETPGRRHGLGEASAGAITRQHRRVEPREQIPTAAQHEVAGPTDDTPVAPVWDDRWATAEPARSGGVDPRLFRIGAVAIILTLLIPFVASFRSSGSDDLMTLATAESVARLDSVPEAIEDATSAAADEGASSAPADDLSDDDASHPSAAPSVNSSAEDPAAPSGDTEVDESSDQGSTSGDVSTDDGAAGAASDGGAESAVVVEQMCAIDYEVQGGDFWLRLADGASVELAELLDANEATVNTPLYPGRTICLPAGSKTPPPPPASNAGSGGSSGGSSSGTSGGSSGSSGSSGGSQPTPTAAPKPAPTVPPTTAAPTTLPPPPPPAPAQVEQIIRNVWPDDLEEKALQIAWRESNYKANVRNYCCLGLFQIYWNVHQSWLGSMGITSSGQLFDAETNTRAAYALYQRSGGWGPWGG